MVQAIRERLRPGARPAKARKGTPAHDVGVVRPTAAE